MCRYGCNEMEIKGIKAVKQTKGLDDLNGASRDGEDAIDKSRLMLAWIKP